MATVYNKAKTPIDFLSSVPYMDDEIRNLLHLKFAPCYEQVFFTYYEERHLEKFGEPWELSKENLTW